MEARLVKDIQPRFNVELKDDKSFPYLQIRMREDFPRVEFTRKPRRRGVKLYGPFTSAKSLRAAIQVLQRIFQFRTCSLDIDADDARWRWFRPCLLHSIRQCTAPCNFRVTKEEYRKQIRGAAAGAGRQEGASCSPRWNARCTRPAPRCSSRRRPACATRSTP